MFGNENDYINADSNNIIFTIKDTKLYVSIVILSAKGNRKLSKLPCKGLERTVYWNEYKSKSEHKNTANEYRHFIESKFIGVNSLFVIIF